MLFMNGGNKNTQKIHLEILVTNSNLRRQFFGLFSLRKVKESPSMGSS